jgi:hypothetical protein
MSPQVGEVRHGRSDILGPFSVKVVRYTQRRVLVLKTWESQSKRSSFTTSMTRLQFDCLSR